MSGSTDTPIGAADTSRRNPQTSRSELWQKNTLLQKEEKGSYFPAIEPNHRIRVGHCTKPIFSTAIPCVQLCSFSGIFAVQQHFTEHGFPMVLGNNNFQCELAWPEPWPFPPRSLSYFNVDDSAFALGVNTVLWWVGTRSGWAYPPPPPCVWVSSHRINRHCNSNQRHEFHIIHRHWWSNSKNHQSSRSSYICIISILIG